MSSIRKNITIPEGMNCYVTDTDLDLSKFVQRHLKEHIIAEGKADKYLQDQKKH